MTTDPRPVIDPTDPCPRCQARDLAADPDAPGITACDDHCDPEDDR